MATQLGLQTVSFATNPIVNVPAAVGLSLVALATWWVAGRNYAKYSPEGANPGSILQVCRTPNVIIWGWPYIPAAFHICLAMVAVKTPIYRVLRCALKYFKTHYTFQVSLPKGGGDGDLVGKEVAQVRTRLSTALRRLC